MERGIVWGQGGAESDPGEEAPEALACTAGGSPGAVKALPGAQRSAQHLAQSRGSKALWSEWKPGWKQKPSREAGTGTVIGGERA